MDAYGFDDIGNRKWAKQGGDSNGKNLRAATYSNNTLNQTTTRGVPSAVDIIGSSMSAGCCPRIVCAGVCAIRRC